MQAQQTDLGKGFAVHLNLENMSEFEESGTST